MYPNKITNLKRVPKCTGVCNTYKKHLNVHKLIEMCLCILN